jgi:radical SAM superfamily enzyme YgiQ (UPF0313 family)
MKIRFITPYYGVKGMRLLTLPCLAAEFSPYCDVELCDQNVEEVDFSDCDMVGISLLVYNAPIGYEIARRFRDRGIPVIAGGSWPTVSPDQVAPHFDSVVVGEVEGLGARIVHDLKKARLKRRYRNTAPPCLDTLRPPRFDLLQNERYLRITGYPMELTRGCPNACTFCVSGKIQPTFRKKPLWMVIRELESRDSPIVDLYDLNATADIAYFKEVMRIFAEFPLLAWQCETCIDSLDDDELLNLMEKARINQVYVGLESISEKSLASINKGFNPVQRYGAIIRKCRDHGIHVAAGFIVGLDGEDKSIFERSLEFFEKVRVEYTTPLYVTYLPGTPMHRRLTRQGRILTQNLADYDGLHPIVRPDRMTVEELEEGVQWFIQEFFGARSVAVRAMQAANVNPLDMLGYLFFNRWFSGMYRGLYQTGPDGRNAMSDRVLFDHMTLKPLDKREYGMEWTDRLMRRVNRADRLLRPVHRMRRKLRPSVASVTESYRNRYPAGQE